MGRPLRRDVVLCDVDHTMSDSSWRDPMLEGAEKWNGWDAYHAHAYLDNPIVEVIQLVNSLSRKFHVIAITVRPDKWRQMTMEWMIRNGVMIEEILMRPDDDFHPSPELKMMLARQRFTDVTKEIALVIDDREDVCTAFRSIGITTLQVSMGKRS